MSAPKSSESGPADSCERCGKPAWLCVCGWIAPLETRTRALILQHPQEPDKELGTARIAAAALSSATLRVGLSWPNLKKALGEEADPKSWLALYLGSAKLGAAKPSSPLVLLNRKNEPLADPGPVISKIRGVVVLDGTWSQAKSLWWRNAWLLKLPRAFIIPAKPSLYGKLRKEPRRESISTIESLAVALSVLDRDPGIEERLLAPFRKLLELYKGSH